MFPALLWEQVWTILSFPRLMSLLLKQGYRSSWSWNEKNFPPTPKHTEKQSTGQHLHSSLLSMILAPVANMNGKDSTWQCICAKERRSQGGCGNYEVVPGGQFRGLKNWNLNPTKQRYYWWGFPLHKRMAEVASSTLHQLVLLGRKHLATVVHSLIKPRLDYYRALLRGAALKTTVDTECCSLTGVGCRDCITLILFSLHWFSVRFQAQSKMLIVTSNTLYILRQAYHMDLWTPIWT